MEFILFENLRSRISQYSGSMMFIHLGSWICIEENLSILTRKTVAKLSKIWSGLFIPDPDPDFLPIPDPGSRGQKGTGSRIWIPNTGISSCLLEIYLEKDSGLAMTELLKLVTLTPWQISEKGLHFSVFFDEKSFFSLQVTTAVRRRQVRTAPWWKDDLQTRCPPRGRLQERTAPSWKDDL
jgi:hypothetical protein